MQCVDWPVVVARLGDPSLCEVPIVVRERVGARDLVRAASREARAEGVRAGMRRREAEACCGEAVVLDADPAAEARAFEKIARAVETFTPRIELHEPGRLTFPTRGPSRYFGGDDALAAKVLDAVGTAMAGTGVTMSTRVGIADGRFAARLAARAANPVAVIAPGASASFLAPYPVISLGDPELAGLLERLGLPMLGDFAGLEASAVLARFGRDGARLHALACGHDSSPAALAAVPPDMRFSMELDPPATRVDSVAFAAKSLADQLVAQLEARGLACTRVLIEAETEHGEQLARSWWHDDGFRPAVLAERLRWQLDGWLAANAPDVDDGDVRAQQDLVGLAESGLDSTTGALTRLTLAPEIVVPVPARQLGFFSGDPAAALRADRCLARVQGMLGFDRVGTFVLQGGRTPTERIAFVPWGEPRLAVRPLVQQGEAVAWPGAWPSPSPTRVFAPGLAAALLDEHDAPVQVSGRGEASAPPRRLRCAALFGNGRVADVVAWAGPWPSDVRWWDTGAHWRGAHWQLLVDTGSSAGAVACWATSSATQATVDAIYD
ncbi:MAG TPA: DNA polymerase Y family protein [Acidimicrobiia bacterium]